MLVRLGQFTVRRRRMILIVSVVLFALAGAIGGGVAEHLSSGGFDDPGAESTRAGEVIDDVFHAGEPNVVLLVTATNGDVDAPAVAAAGQALTAELAADRRRRAGQLLLDPGQRPAPAQHRRAPGPRPRPHRRRRGHCRRPHRDPLPRLHPPDGRLRRPGRWPGRGLPPDRRPPSRRTWPRPSRWPSPSPSSCWSSSSAAWSPPGCRWGSACWRSSAPSWSCGSSPS